MDFGSLCALCGELAFGELGGLQESGHRVLADDVDRGRSLENTAESRPRVPAGAPQGSGLEVCFLGHPVRAAQVPGVLKEMQRARPGGWGAGARPGKTQCVPSLRDSWWGFWSKALDGVRVNEKSALTLPPGGVSGLRGV